MMKQATATVRTSRMSVFFVFILNREKSGAPPPPDSGAEDRRNKRHENEDDPAHIAQSCFFQGEGQRLRNFRRDADHLFTAEQPVDTAGDKVEALLVLGKHAVFDEAGIADDDEARRIDVYARVTAAALL